MKKFLSAAVLCLILALPCAAYAYQNGDVTGMVTYSGIDTYINNYPINAYNLDGRQVIAAEDLRGYGFSVVYDDSTRSLSISPDYSTQSITRDDSIKREYYLMRRKAYDTIYSDITAYINGSLVESYNIDGKTMIPIRALETIGTVDYSYDENWSKATIDGLPMGEYAPLETSYDKRLTVVLDAGHGKSSGLMSDSEKIAEGYTTNGGSWGEWRHWKNGTADVECEGSGCRGDRACWYPIGNGDRDTEPAINLNNVLAAKDYLENTLGYNVRLTRSSNDENPSFSKRVSYCYPNNDLSAQPDASVYVCVHSNAGGGRGSAYISAEGSYNQKWINNGFADESNKLGYYINQRIVNETSMSMHGSGHIDGEGYLILFNKCPIPAGYMEIGFFDSSSDRAILESEYNAIGQAIARGIDDYMHGY